MRSFSATTKRIPTRFSGCVIDRQFLGNCQIFFGTVTFWILQISFFRFITLLETRVCSESSSSFRWGADLIFEVIIDTFLNHRTQSQPTVSSHLTYDLKQAWKKQDKPYLERYTFEVRVRAARFPASGSVLKYKVQLLCRISQTFRISGQNQEI